jgi:hypothetical protein
MERKRWTIVDTPVEQPKATRAPAPVDETLLLRDASAEAIGRELARRGRAETLAAIRRANLDARPEPEPKPAVGLDNEVVRYIVNARRWLTLTELRRRFQGDRYRGNKLIDAINTGLSNVRGFRRRTRAGRVEQLIGVEWLDNPKD